MPSIFKVEPRFIGDLLLCFIISCRHGIFVRSIGWSQLAWVWALALHKYCPCDVHHGGWAMIYSLASWGQQWHPLHEMYMRTEWVMIYEKTWNKIHAQKMAYKVSYYILLLCIYVSYYIGKKTIFKNLNVELHIVATFSSSKNVHSIYIGQLWAFPTIDLHMWTNPVIGKNAPFYSAALPDPWTLSASSQLPAQLSQLTSLTVGHCHGLLSIHGPS